MTTGNNVSDFVNETNEILTGWNITAVLILQDAETKLDTTVFPHIHLIHHTIKLLKVSSLFEFTTDYYETIHCGQGLKVILESLQPLNKKLVSIKDLMGSVHERHLVHPLDPLVDGVFTGDMMNDFYHLYDSVTIRQPDLSPTRPSHSPNDVTVQLMRSYFETMNGLFNRKNCIDQNQLRQLSQIVITNLHYKMC